MDRKGIAVLSVACFFILVLYVQALAGTVDEAALSPRYGFSTIGNSVITFSALNNKDFVLTSYEVTITYNRGIGATITSLSPDSGTAVVDPGTGSIHFLWRNIAPGTEMRAAISINGNIGYYSLTPSSVIYYNQKKRYTGSCNSVLLAFRKEALPIESRPENNSIEISWMPSPTSGVVGYRLYKRTSTTAYSLANSFYVKGLRYTDTNVQNSVGYYYRLAAVDRAGNELETSPETAEMLLTTEVRAYSAPAGRSIAIGDIDGNGIPDLVVGGPPSGFRKWLNNRVDIYMNNNVSSKPDFTLYGENSGDMFGTALVLVDVNNDGYDDLIVGAPAYISQNYYTTKTGKVYVYIGGPSFSASPVRTFTGREVYTCNHSGIYSDSEGLGEVIAVAGDVNGDGFKDVAVGSHQGGLDRSGRVLFLLGSAGGVCGAVEVRGPNCGDHLGSSVSSVGDVNGDGYDDVIATAIRDSALPGKGYLIYGGPAPYLSGIEFSGDMNGFASTVTGLDMNGDGFSDIAVGGKSWSNDITLFLGSSGPDLSPNMNFGDSRNPTETTFIASMGDLNGDGYEDLLTSSGISNGAAIFMGHHQIDNIADALLPGLDVKDLKDVDRDGLKEIVATTTGGISLHSLASYADLPYVVVTSPGNYETVNTLNLSVSGIVHGSITRLLVGGQETQADHDGSFQAQVPVVLGWNGIEIIAQGKDGRIAKRKLYGTYGAPPTAVQITSPVDGTTVCEGAINVVGTVSQTGAHVGIGWSGISSTASTVSATTTGNNFQAPIRLFAGVNTITATAIDPYGNRATHTIHVTYDTTCTTPIVTFRAQSQVIQEGQAITLSWTTMNATSVTIDNGIGTVPVEGSVEVSPTQTTTYTLSAMGPGGTSTASVTVTVLPPLPTVAISVSPSSIVVGSSSTLTWNSTNATSVTIDNGIGPVAVSGSLSIAPSQTTTYMITALGPGGKATSSATIIVTDPPSPTVTIVATPAVIESGHSSTLTWTSTNATSAVIDNGIGAVDANGSLIVSPPETTTYHITVTGPGGTATAFFRVYLKDNGAYSYGDPTPAEQAFLEAVNRTRLNPQAEATRLGIDLFEGVPRGAISGLPVQPLAFNAKLLQAAYLHAQDMMVHQYYDHISQDGRTFSDRIAQAGYEARVTAENLSSSFSTEPQDEVPVVLSLHDHLFVDADVAGRVHRVNILTGVLREMGVGFVSGSYQGYPYTYLLTNDFGASLSEPDPFILGVVYDDLNGDGAYTAGEGVGNVQIIIYETGAATVTASAGGYALPMPPGSYTVRAILPDGREASRNVTLSSQNIKVDFLTADFYHGAPAVSISADPTTILPGGSSTLTWTSTNATSAVIDNGIGAVAVNGSVSVSPSRTTTYAITVTGQGGVKMGFTTVFVNAPSPITLAITSPSDGQAIKGTNVTVSGTVNNPSGNETGVSVNGVNAIVSGGTFIAGNVSLEEGRNVITATATDVAANTAEISVAVDAITTADSVRIMALNSIGVSPFETTLRVEASFPIQGTPLLTHKGPGTVTFLESPYENEYVVRMTTVGVYTFTIEVRDEANNAYTNSVAVQVIDRVGLDQMLRTKWEGMKEALMAGNVSAALQYFTEGSQEKYGAMFTALSTSLPGIIGAMREISFAYMDGDRFAVYRMPREEIIRGQPYQITYHINFVRDEDGIWRISWF